MTFFTFDIDCIGTLDILCPFEIEIGFRHTIPFLTVMIHEHGLLKKKEVLSGS